MKRVSVFIDGANFYYGLKSLNRKYTDFYFDFEKYIKKIIGKNKLIRIYYYNAPLIQKYDKELYWRQMKFFARMRKINKMKVVLCKRQQRTNDQDKEYYVIKGDDIYLAIDMIRDALKDKYDKAILISGDGDFSPVVKYVKQEKKQVEVLSFKEIASFSLTRVADMYRWIDKRTVNKYFWRGWNEKQFKDILRR